MSDPIADIIEKWDLGEIMPIDDAVKLIEAEIMRRHIIAIEAKIKPMRDLKTTYKNDGKREAIQAIREAQTKPSDQLT